MEIRESESLFERSPKHVYSEVCPISLNGAYFQDIYLFIALYWAEIFRSDPHTSSGPSKVTGAGAISSIEIREISKNY